MESACQDLTCILGIIDNISLLVVCLSSLPIFWDVYKKKTTEEFQLLPYVVGLFNSLLWIYYAMLNDETTTLIIAIRSVGIVTQTFYLCVFVFYAPKRRRMECLMLILLFIVIGFGLIVLLIQFLTKGDQRVVIVGWVFLVLSFFCVVLAPLGVLTQVIKTKSVKYMPILPVLSVTLGEVVSFFYGLLLKDVNIMIPKTLGFIMGVIQIIVYFVYKNAKPGINHSITKNKEQNTTGGAATPHGVAVVPGPIFGANHTIHVPA